MTASIYSWKPIEPVSTGKSSYDRITSHIKPRQARELLEAAEYAKSIGLPLEVHASIHWALTDAGDDPKGKFGVRVREGLSKCLKRRGIPFAAIWVRERASGGQAEVEHLHLLFHLPRAWQKGEKLADITNCLERLINRHAGYVYDGALEITLPRNSDIRYLLKGSPPKIQRELRIKRTWRSPQGLILGKRCGATEKIGRKARDALNCPILNT